jgi:hypothetical protein
MTKEEFLAAIVGLGFQFDETVGCYTREGWPMIHVWLKDGGRALSTFNYCGDTGPISITEPEVAPFEKVLAGIREWIR